MTMGKRKGHLVSRGQLGTHFLECPPESQLVLRLSGLEVVIQTGAKIYNYVM